MSTRSGKRIHNSFHEDIILKPEPEVELVAKSERKTRSKRLKENIEEVVVSVVKSKKRTNYVSYPAGSSLEEENGSDSVEGKEEETKPTRTLRKNTLKERNYVTPIEENIEPSIDARKSVRTTRRTRKFPEEAPEDTLEQNVEEEVVEKPKKVKKKKHVQEVEEIAVKKKTKKKKSRGSGPIIVEDLEPKKALNKSNISNDSFHSAAGSPLSKDAPNASIACPGNDDAMETEQTGIILRRRTRSINKTNGILNTSNNIKVSRKRKTSTKETDKSIKETELEVVHESKKRKSMNTEPLEVENSTFELENNRKSIINNSLVKPGVNTTYEKDSSKLEAEKSVRDATFDKIEDVEILTRSGRKSLRKSIINTTYEKSANNSLADLNMRKSIINTTYEKAKNDTAQDIEIKTSIQNNTFDKTDETLEKSSQDLNESKNRKTSKKLSNIELNNTFDKQSNSTFDKIEQLDSILNKTEKHDSTFEKVKANSTFDKSEKLDSTFNKTEKLDSTFNKTEKLDYTYEKEKADSTFDKEKPNTTFDKTEKLDSTVNKTEKLVSTFEKVKVNTTSDKIEKLDSTYEKEEAHSNFDKSKKFDSTFDKNSKSSLLSSDNSNDLDKSNLTLDKSNISRISITSDESKENIVNMTPVLIESSLDESQINLTKTVDESMKLSLKSSHDDVKSSKSSPETSSKSPIEQSKAKSPVTPLKREGTFTKDSPVASPRASLTKRMSLPSPGCTPFPNRSATDRPMLNVTRSIEKRRSSLVEPLPRLTKVMFCSPVNNPVVVMQQRRKVIKSNLKGSNKSFVFDDSASTEPRAAARKRSYTHSDAEEARAKRTRLATSTQLAGARGPRSRTCSATAKLSEPSTPSKQTPSKPSRTKLPNFAALHQKQFDRMESLDECQRRRARRARQLLTPTGSVAVLDRTSPRDNTPEPKQENQQKDKDTKQKEPKRPKETKSKESKKPETPVKSLPTFKSLNPGYTRFGFKLNLDANPFSASKGDKNLFSAKKAEIFQFSSKKESKVNEVTLKRQVTAPSLAGTTSVRREVARQTVMREKSFTDKRKENRNDTRTVIKGVRTNRRFELQMRMRNLE